jgi:hypothetical protein
MKGLSVISVSPVKRSLAEGAQAAFSHHVAHIVSEINESNREPGYLTPADMT